jgi:hypothetical protein
MTEIHPASHSMGAAQSTPAQSLSSYGPAWFMCRFRGLPWFHVRRPIFRNGRNRASLPPWFLPMPAA